MYTEEEASEIRCCVRLLNITYCISSKCMAWRWIYGKKIADSQPSEHYIVLENTPCKVKTDRGYCGKAGKS